MRGLIALALILAASSAFARCVAADGDSLVCDGRKVRIVNIWAAELNEPGGKAAKKRLQTLIAGKDVVIVPRGNDRYGRTLADVYVDGRQIQQSDIGPRAGRGSGVRNQARKNP